MTRNDFHELLLKHAPSITAEQHKKLLDGLQADGIIDGSGGVIRATAVAPSDAGKPERKLLSPMQAMRRSELHPMLKHAAAQLRRAGFDLDFSSDKPLSVVEIDKAFKAAGLDTETRIWIKSELGALNLL